MTHTILLADWWSDPFGIGAGFAERNKIRRENIKKLRKLFIDKLGIANTSTISINDYNLMFGSKYYFTIKNTKHSEWSKFSILWDNINKIDIDTAAGFLIINDTTCFKFGTI